MHTLMHIPEEGHTQKTREEEVDPGSSALFKLTLVSTKRCLLAKTFLHHKFLNNATTRNHYEVALESRERTLYLLYSFNPSPCFSSLFFLFQKLLSSFTKWPLPPAVDKGFRFLTSLQTLCIDFSFSLSSMG